MASSTVAERFVHPALFYRSADEYLAATTAFLHAGLDADEPVAVAVPGPKLESIRQRLGDRAADVTMLDMTQVGRNPGRIIPTVLLAFADAHPQRPVRIIGEPIWPGRTELEYPACVQHEALINMAFAGRQATILCPYDVAQLDEQVVRDAHLTHPMLLDAAGEHTSRHYAPTQVVQTYNLPLPKPEAAPISAYLFHAGTLAQTRAYAAAHLTRHGLDAERCREAVDAVAALADNSVRHGQGRGVLEIWADDTSVTCQVRDAGTLTDPLAGRRPGTRDTGLLLANRLADLVRIHAISGSTTVRLLFARDRPTPTET